MNNELKLDEIVDTCIHLYKLIDDFGTPQMLAMTRALLFEIAKELARSTSFDHEGNERGCHN